MHSSGDFIPCSIFLSITLPHKCRMLLCSQGPLCSCVDPALCSVFQKVSLRLRKWGLPPCFPPLRVISPALLIVVAAFILSGFLFVYGGKVSSFPATLLWLEQKTPHKIQTSKNTNRYPASQRNPFFLPSDPSHAIVWGF